jgi:hypothetical protein
VVALFLWLNCYVTPCLASGCTQTKSTLVCSNSILDLLQSDGAASFRGHWTLQNRIPTCTPFFYFPLFCAGETVWNGSEPRETQWKGGISSRLLSRLPPQAMETLWLSTTCHPGGTQGSRGNETYGSRPEMGVRPAHEPMVPSVDN